MADYSKQLFYLEGCPPDFLPKKIRLPDKTTRTPKDVTLEELSSCGYRGPVCPPDCDSNCEVVRWCSESETYKVELKTFSEDKQVRALLQRAVKHYLSQDSSNWTLLYQKNVALYVYNCQKLLSCSRNLNFSDDYFNLDSPVVRDESAIADIISTYFSRSDENKLKLTYENFGFVFNYPLELVGQENYLVGDWEKNLNNNYAFVLSQEVSNGDTPLKPLMPSASGYQIDPSADTNILDILGTNVFQDIYFPQ